MSTSFSSDVNKVAREASSHFQTIMNLSLNAAEFNHFRTAETMKYNLNRLSGMLLITAEEQDKFNRIADLVGSGGNISELAGSIQAPPDASPLAVALAGIVEASLPETVAGNFSGAVAGALIGFGSGSDLIQSDDGSAQARALACILTAIGGASANAGAALIAARAKAAGA